MDIQLKLVSMIKNCEIYLVIIFFFLIQSLELISRYPISLNIESDLLRQGIYGFVKNQNQLENEALFYSSSKNQNISIFRDKIVFEFYEYHISDAKVPEDSKLNEQTPGEKVLINKKGVVVALEFLNFNPDFKIIPDGELEKIHIFKNKSSKTDLKKFSRLYFERVYDNIDLVLFFDKGKFRFDFVLKENANPDVIKFKIDGINNIKQIFEDFSKEHSKLELASNNGNVFFSEIKSFYIDENSINSNQRFAKEELNSAQLIKTEYNVENNVISFKISDYDKTRPVVIDPVVYSTFFGGMDIDEITGMVLDKNNDIIITGWSRSENFRTTPGSYDTLFYSEIDCFVSKFRLVGPDKKLVFSTLLGGNADDYAKAISIDPDGNIYIAGETESFDYPVKNTPYAIYSGLKDGFVSKFSSDGAKLLYSTYFGGSRQDRINSIAVGGAGEIYVTGGTYSNDIPITITYNDNNPNNKGLEEAFITKFYSNGSVQYSYLLTSLGFDYGSVIAINEKAGMLVVGGQTNSPGLFVSPRSGDNSVIDYMYNGGQDIYLAMFTPGLGTFNFSTFIGGSEDDYISDILIDDEGNIIIAGQTSTKNAAVNPSVVSTDFRITNTAYQKKNNGGFDAFVMTLNRNATRLLGSTFLGGKNNEHFLSMDFNANKTSLYLTGFTQSADFPKVNANENEKYLAKKDIIICNLSLDCSKLFYSSIIGASGDDIGNCIVIDKYDGINIAGTTNSNDFPLFEPLEKSYLGGTNDGFIYRKLLKTLYLTANLKSINYCQNENIYLSWMADGFEKGHKFFVDVSSDNGLTWTPIVSNYDSFEYIWKVPSNFPAGSLNKIRVYSPSGMVAYSEGNFGVLSSPRIRKLESNSADNIFCEGDSLEIVSEVEGEQLKFQWQKDGHSLTNNTEQNLKIQRLSLLDEGSYSLSLTGKCKPDVKSSPISIKIKPKTEILKNLENKIVKNNDNVEFRISAKGLNLSYEWQRNGIKIMNQSDSVLVINNVNHSFEGFYRCIVKGECGIDTSYNAYLQIDTSIISVDGIFREQGKINLKTMYSRSIDEQLEIDSEDNYNVKIYIFDFKGKESLFLENITISKGQNYIPLDFSQFAVGLYSVTIKCNQFSKKNLILILE